MIFDCFSNLHQSYQFRNWPIYLFWLLWERCFSFHIHWSFVFSFCEWYWRSIKNFDGFFEKHVMNCNHKTTFNEIESFILLLHSCSMSNNPQKFMIFLSFIFKEFLGKGVFKKPCTSEYQLPIATIRFYKRPLVLIFSSMNEEFK